jgi:hypothetical protein
VTYTTHSVQINNDYSFTGAVFSFNFDEGTFSLYLRTHLQKGKKKKKEIGKKEIGKKGIGKKE